jgi:type I restriction enzyme R subunit
MTEDQLEQEALGWLAELGYTPVYGPDIAPDGDQPERGDYRQVVLVERLSPAQKNTRWVMRNIYAMRCLMRHS